MNRPELSDDLLGTLHHDEELDWYFGGWAGGPVAVEFSLNLDEAGRVEPALARARGVLAGIAEYADAAQEYAVAELLDAANEWLDEGDEPVTPALFKGRMTLQAVVFDPDGDVIFYHHDGGLFSGHAIQVGMDAEDKFNHADIPG